MHRSKEGVLFDHLAGAGVCAGSFGQPSFAEPLGQQLRVRSPAPGDPRGYCKARIDLKQTRHRLRTHGEARWIGRIPDR
jgi:hypothetical protein